MVKCPYCGNEGYFEELRNPWKFLFYSVKRLRCPKCGGIFNLYSGVSPKGKSSEFVIRIKPRRGKG
jgi:transposase